MKAVRPLLIALQFLTRMPLRLRDAPGERELGCSVLFYPLVGLLIGLLLTVLASLFSHIPNPLGAALLLAAWVLATGGLHLDGLADTADAWVGGRGEPERTLAIMKDPYCGPIGVAALVIVLLVKFAALASTADGGHAAGLMLAPVLARTALPLLFLTTPYVRPGGLGSAMSAQLPRKAAMAVVAAAGACIVVFFGSAGFLVLAGAAGTFFLLRRWMMLRIGGTTGDTAGCTVEVVETVVVVLGAILAAPRG